MHAKLSVTCAIPSLAARDWGLIYEVVNDEEPALRTDELTRKLVDGPTRAYALIRQGTRQAQDFLVEDHRISRVGDHLKRITGGAEGDESYATFFLLASFRALTPR